MNTTEIIARGVCRYRGHVLLCRNRKHGNVYLPGGHIEGEERAAVALQRELMEELGRHGSIGNFLGMVQHAFTEKKQRVVELNFVFQFSLPQARLDQPPASAEKKIEFLWWPLKTLARSGIEPRILVRVLPGWLRLHAGPDRCVSTF